MSKRPKHLRQLWKRSSTFTKVLTAFVTLAMVLEMFPAQSVAYARQVVLEATGFEPTAILAQEAEPAVSEEQELAAQEEAAVPEEQEAAAEEEPVVSEDETQVEPAPEPEATEQEEGAVDETEPEPAVEPETTPESEKQEEAEVDEETDAEPAAGEEEAQTEDASEADPTTEEPKAEEKQEEPAKVEYPAQTLKARLGNTLIYVTAPKDSLPANSRVIAKWVDTSEVQDAVEAAAAAEGKTVEDMVAIDVTIVDANGKEIQPLLPVQVKFLNAGVQGDDISVYHIDDATAEAAPVTTDGLR